jgi:hypothetical protein
MKKMPKYFKLVKILCQGHVSFSCVNEFPNEGDEIKFDSWPGSPTTSISDDKVEKVRALVRNDRRLTARITAELNIKKETVRQILMESFGIKE